MQKTSYLGGRRPKTGARLLQKISPGAASRGEAELARAAERSGAQVDTGACSSSRGAEQRPWFWVPAAARRRAGLGRRRWRGPAR